MAIAGLERICPSCGADHVVLQECMESETWENVAQAEAIILNCPECRRWWRWQPKRKRGTVGVS